jgi:3-methyl-2-oxobutanoate hydroxymethyltransferase
MKKTILDIKKMKGGKPWSMLTAYDALSASWIEAVDFPAILVGDSLGMTTLGYNSTLPVTMNEMIHHTSAVTRVVEKSLVIADMPFMSYQDSIENGVFNAGRFIKESNADAVKVEGGVIRSALIKALVKNGIPVLAHIGLTPQSIKELGVYRTHGIDKKERKEILEDAIAVQDAGAFAVVLECIPDALSEEITNTVFIPTIGIGAGPSVDAQILVISDLLGLSSKKPPSFVKPFANLYNEIEETLKKFKESVENRSYHHKSRG